MPTALSQAYWNLNTAAKRLLYTIARPQKVVLHNGNWMFFDRADTRSFALWTHQGNVNPDSLRLWESLLQACKWTIVLDVGANYGEMLLYPIIPSAAKVYAFEPNARIASLLRHSVAECDLAAEIVESAVGDVDGTVPMHFDMKWSGTSSILAKNTSGSYRVQQVPILRLDTFLMTRVADPTAENLLIKIDVEGLESSVMAGFMSSALKWKNLAIMLEVHRMPPDSFREMSELFDVLIQNETGKLQLLQNPRLDNIHSMDVVLVRRGEASKLV